MKRPQQQRLAKDFENLAETLATSVYARLDPTGPQAACQGVGRELTEVCQAWTAVLPRPTGQRRGCAGSGRSDARRLTGQIDPDCPS